MSELFCCVSISDEFNKYCDRLEKTAEWGGQAEVLHLVTICTAARLCCHFNHLLPSTLFLACFLPVCLCNICRFKWPKHVQDVCVIFYQASLSLLVLKSVGNILCISFRWLWTPTICHSVIYFWQQNSRICLARSLHLHQAKINHTAIKIKPSKFLWQPLQSQPLGVYLLTASVLSCWYDKSS